MSDFFTPDENNSSSLMKRIGRACKGLMFLSETDAPIVPFFRAKGQKDPASEVDPTTASSQTLEDFFGSLTEIRDWYGDAEKKTAEKFAELKSVLEEDLRDLRVLKVGQVSVDIYVIGTDVDGNFAGVQTKAVET